MTEPPIRAATRADAPWIAAIWNDVIAHTLVTFTTVQKSHEAVERLIATQTVLVMPEVGFATYGPFRSGPGYAATVEHSIYLAPAVCGQGQGARLLTALMGQARGDGVHVMVAGISGANPGAVRFHGRMGFAEVGRMAQVGRKDGQWLDLVLMQKLLNV